MEDQNAELERKQDIEIVYKYGLDSITNIEKMHPIVNGKWLNNKQHL